MDIAIVIATHGDDRWQQLALQRAFPSAENQGCEVVVHHDPAGTVASVRNHAVMTSGLPVDGWPASEWLIFLDADDELAPGYVDAMREAVERIPDPWTLFTPATANRRGQQGRFWPGDDLRKGNPLVIGTMISREAFNYVGGFSEDYEVFEDWHLWAKCWQANATIARVPDAVYIIHREPKSRVRSLSKNDRLRWHYRVGRDLFPDLYPEDWLASHGVT